MREMPLRNVLGVCWYPSWTRFWLPWNFALVDVVNTPIRAAEFGARAKSTKILAQRKKETLLIKSCLVLEYPYQSARFWQLLS